MRCADRLLLFDGETLRVGAPEDLVRSGHFARVFLGEGVTFEIDAGHFELNRVSHRAVRLIGAGPRAHWTRRALERAGIGVDAKAASSVTVESDSWSLNADGRTVRLYCLHDLLVALAANAAP